MTFKNLRTTNLVPLIKIFGEKKSEFILSHRSFCVISLVRCENGYFPPPLRSTTINHQFLFPLHFHSILFSDGGNVSSCQRTEGIEDTANTGLIVAFLERAICNPNLASPCLPLLGHKATLPLPPQGRDQGGPTSLFILLPPLMFNIFFSPPDISFPFLEVGRKKKVEQIGPIFFFFFTFPKGGNSSFPFLLLYIRHFHSLSGFSFSSSSSFLPGVIAFPQRRKKKGP